VPDGARGPPPKRLPQESRSRASSRSSELPRSPWCLRETRAARATSTRPTGSSSPDGRPRSGSAACFASSVHRLPARSAQRSPADRNRRARGGQIVAALHLPNRHSGCSIVGRSVRVRRALEAVSGDAPGRSSTGGQADASRQAYRALVPDGVRTPWWQQSWLLAVLGAITLVLIVLNVLGRDWLGLGTTVLLLYALASLWWSSRRQRRHRSVERPTT